MVIGVTVLIPAYNEAESIRETLRRVEESCRSFAEIAETIVIDDGSTDGTADIARGCGVRVVRHQSNLGYGAALKTGLRHAGGSQVVIIDADLTYPPESIPELVGGLAESDMVVGARTGPEVHIPFLRKPAKWVLTKLANRVAEREIPDLNSGLRAFRKDLAERYLHLFPNGFSFTTTLTLAAICDGHRVEFFPISYAKRKGRSKIRPFKDTFNFLVLILRVAAYFEPLRVFLPAAFFSGLVALFLLAFYFIRDRGISDSGILACVVTLLIFLMGILADLVVRRSRS